MTSSRVPFLFDASQARCLLKAAATLPDNSRARQRGPTYHAIFALCYGLGLRAGEACGPGLSDIDTGRRLLVVRGGKFGKSRLVPHGPRIAGLVAEHVKRPAGRWPGNSSRRPAVQLRRQAVRPSRHREPDVPPSGSRPRPRRSRGSLAAQLPAAVLADILGLQPGTAVRWMHDAGADWNRYAADLARTRNHQPRE